MGKYQKSLSFVLGIFMLLGVSFQFVAPVAAADGDIPIARGSTASVPAGGLCKGDIQDADKGLALYDHGLANRGNVVVFKTTTNVYAQYGANCMAPGHRTPGSFVDELRGTGCSGGCAEVAVWCYAPLSKVGIATGAYTFGDNPCGGSATTVTTNTQSPTITYTPPATSGGGNACAALANGLVPYAVLVKTGNLPDQYSVQCGSTNTPSNFVAGDNGIIPLYRNDMKSVPAGYRVSGDVHIVFGNTDIKYYHGDDETIATVVFLPGARNVWAPYGADARSVTTWNDVVAECAGKLMDGTHKSCYIMNDPVPDGLAA